MFGLGGEGGGRGGGCVESVWMGLLGYWVKDRITQKRRWRLLTWSGPD